MSEAASARRRWVHLPVEVKARELQSRLLLGLVAAERGYGAVVGAKTALADAALTLPRGVYVEKSCQLGGLSGYRARRAMGHTECCLDEEGVVYVDAEDYSASRLSAPSLAVMHRFFAWGEDQAGVVAKFHPEASERVVVTGNPRVDLWRPELRGIYRREADDLRAMHGPFVLLASAFAMVNNSRGADYFLEIVGENGRLATARGEAQARGFVEHSRSLFEAMRLAIVEVARALPEHKVIIRPHPSEDASTWEQLSEAAPNLVVIREGPVTPWLLAASVVVHSNCTTGMEAYLMGRPTVAYAPREDARYDQNLPNAVSNRARNPDELVDLVRRAVTSGSLAAPDDGIELLRDHISALDGRLASERLVDAFDEIETAEQSLRASFWRTASGRARATGDRLVGGARRGGSKVAQGGAGLSTSRTATTAKFAGSSLGEVHSFLDRLREVSGRFGGLTVFELEPDVYAIVPTEDR